ncbi:MAG: hypothetical protein M3R52_13200 [Acidobacteriota bacterium]|nr:hypothetical protein [Acidobacteriota bacterium]
MPSFRIIVTLTLLLVALACTARKSELRQQNASPEPVRTNPETATPPTGDSVIFKITKVEVTRKPQEFFQGVSGSTFEPIVDKIKPSKGNVYVIVAFSVDFPSEELSYDSDKDLVLSGSVGCGESLGEGTWLPCGAYKDAKIKKGSLGRIYHIPSDRVQAATIHFKGSEYPIAPYLPTSRVN